MKLRLCSRCGLRKLENAFYRDRSGLRPECKHCKREISKEDRRRKSRSISAPSVKALALIFVFFTFALGSVEASFDVRGTDASVVRLLSPLTTEVEAPRARLIRVALIVVFPGEVRLHIADTLEGISPAGLVEMYYPVRRGFVCSSFEDVLSIGPWGTSLPEGERSGVIGAPSGRRYWRVSVNGSYADVNAHRTRLEASDVVEWAYVEEER